MWLPQEALREQWGSWRLNHATNAEVGWGTWGWHSSTVLPSMVRAAARVSGLLSSLSIVWTAPAQGAHAAKC
jgi:hypothetical protein